MNKTTGTVWLLFLLLLLSCKEEKVIDAYVLLTGSTMGTSYKVTCKSNGIPSDSLQKVIKRELKLLNDGLSTYQEDAVISMFNEYGDITLDTTKTAQLHFYRVYKSARRYYNISDFDFDPTVMPLVNHWGFGYEKVDRTNARSGSGIANIKADVSMSLIDEFNLDGKIIISKKRKGTELDFSAIAKGYGVDIVAQKLFSLGIEDYLVDIGGEMVARGKNKKNKLWTIGINRPLEDATLSQADIFVQLDNVAMASSGNYRNFYEVDGKKYSHTINPKTGYPERSNLLGVSIISKDCMDADAIATTCMVKGLDEAKKFIDVLPHAEGCFIYNENDSLATYYSSGFSKYLTLLNK